MSAARIIRRPAVLLFPILPVALVAAALCLSCAGFGRMFERPRVRVLGADVTSVSLESVQLVFDCAVVNPNRVTLHLHAVGYHLHVNGEPLLDGRSDQNAEIAARGESRVQLPVTLRYTDVLRVLHSLAGEKHAAYDLDADFRFSVPVLGEMQIPVRQRGDFPLDRIRLSF